VWPESEPDGVPTLGLAQGEYKLWAIWIWLYCIFWWLIQDVAKVGTYWLVYRFDIFHAVSGKYVNMREAVSPNDEQHKV
jgi:H+-transporting ATPase